MTLAESRKTHSWQDAIELGPQLVSLAEALPSHESTGLVMALQSLMVEVPAAITHDLIHNGETRFAPVYRLSAALEVIERVYPALDGAGVRSSLDALASRLASEHFNEVIALPAAATTLDEAEPEAASEPATQPDAEPEPATPQFVPVIPQPEGQTVHVQPDSLQ